jgi:hypothetical protein
MTDKNGRIINEPEHAFSHSMDGIRYALTNLVKQGVPSERDYLNLHTMRKERVDSRVDMGLA